MINLSEIEEQEYIEARKRVAELKDFYKHLTSFIVVNLGLFTINLIFSPNDLWFYWTFFGWGFGLFFHAIYVFEIFPYFGKEWEKQQIKKILEKEK